MCHLFIKFICCRCFPKVEFETRYVSSILGKLKVIEVILSMLSWCLMVGITYGHPAREFPLVTLIFSWILNGFWIILHSKPDWFSPEEILNLEPVKFPILEVGISVFWSLLVFASSCCLAVDTGGYIRLAIANLFAFILFAIFMFNLFISYKALIAHDPWKDPENVEEEQTKPKELKSKFLRKKLKILWKNTSKSDNEKQPNQNKENIVNS